MTEQQEHDSRMQFANPEKVARDFNYWAQMCGGVCKARVDGKESIAMSGPIEQVRRLFQMAMECPTGLDAQEKSGAEGAIPDNELWQLPPQKMKQMLAGHHVDRVYVDESHLSDPLDKARIKLITEQQLKKLAASVPPEDAPRKIERRDSGAYIGVMKIKPTGGRETLMKIVSLYGFEPRVPKGYISDKHPWVKAHYTDKAGGEGFDMYLELGETIDEIKEVRLGDVYTGETFSKIYKYLMRAGDRYGRLKRHDKSCHHSIERFEV